MQIENQELFDIPNANETYNKIINNVVFKKQIDNIIIALKKSINEGKFGECVFTKTKTHDKFTSIEMHELNAYLFKIKSIFESKGYKVYKIYEKYMETYKIYIEIPTNIQQSHNILHTNKTINNQVSYDIPYAKNVYNEIINGEKFKKNIADIKSNFKKGIDNCEFKICVFVKYGDSFFSPIELAELNAYLFEVKCIFEPKGYKVYEKKCNQCKYIDLIAQKIWIEIPTPINLTI